MTRRVPLAAGLVLLFALSVTVLGAVGSASAVAPCTDQTHRGVLPVWMQSGFGKNPVIPYTLGKRGAIGAAEFGAPLHSPAAPGRSNKILWVPRHLSKTVAPMWIKLQKMDGTQLVGAPVREIVTNGPGPSYVDAPSAGCWRLTLTWSGRRDTVDLVYTAPS